MLRDEARGKDLPVRATWPDDAGTHPVVVFSHGAYGSKDGYAPLAEHWASHGYVVLQPTHEDSLAYGAKPLEEAFRGFASRPKDVALLLDRLAEVRAALDGYEGTFDAGRVGVAGHSFGAHTAQLLAGATAREGEGEPASYADPRPKAFLLLSPQGRGGELDERSWEGVTRPFLVLTGTEDGGRGGQPFVWRLDPFLLAPPGDKHLVLVLGARHGFGGIAGTARFPTSGPANAGHLDLVKAASLLFLDRYVRGREAAAAPLAATDLSTASGGRARHLAK